MRRSSKLQTKIALAAVSRIRARNNRCWIAILALAVEARPMKAKAIIQKISKNDQEVTKWLSRI